MQQLLARDKDRDRSFRDSLTHQSSTTGGPMLHLLRMYGDKMRTAQSASTLGHLKQRATAILP